MQDNEAKIKVMYVITKGNWGGAQRYVFDLATSLPKDKFEVLVVCGQGNALPEKLKDKNLPVIQIKNMTRNISFFSEIKSFFGLVKIIKKEKPDILHLNSPKASGLGALAGRLLGIKKIIFTAHGFAFNEDRNIFGKSIIWFFSWLIILLCHKTIVIAEKERRQALAMPFARSKIVLIHNGIAIMQFGNGQIIRSAFPEGVKIVGTIGELTENKNQESLIEEARKNPEMYMAIVGEGELIKKLENKIKRNHLENRVKLFGFIPSEEVLKGFDTFALPSKKEGLPYVLLEAKQAGLPITANRVGGVSDILDATDMKEFSLDKMVSKTLEIYK